MLSVNEAQQAFQQFAARRPLLLDGTLYVDEWYEDASDYLPVWGAREFYVDGDHSYARWDQRVVFIDKASGAVRVEYLPDHVVKVGAMTPVAVAR
ncbi:hypothetical protein [Streptomyces sp. NPDC057689]|uniref:hypothetical protein n=1 Tax=Streptomyces sp. NPDC057689 TaxID=3346213 RepID=UPI0036AD5818